MSPFDPVGDCRLTTNAESVLFLIPLQAYKASLRSPGDAHTPYGLRVILFRTREVVPRGDWSTPVNSTKSKIK